MGATAVKHDHDDERSTLIPPAFAAASERYDHAGVEPVPPTLRRFVERHRTVVPCRAPALRVASGL